MTTTTPLDTPVNDDELRKQVLKAGEDFAIDRGDALRRAGYNRENALEHYENQFVNAILSQIQKDRQQRAKEMELDGRIVGMHELESTFEFEGIPLSDKQRQSKREYVEQLEVQLEALQLNGGKKRE